MKDDPNYKVRHEAVEAALKELGLYIAAKTPAGFGFTLLLYKFGENGSMFYMSNAQRDTMIMALDEFKKLLEKPSEPPNVTKGYKA